MIGISISSVQLNPNPSVIDEPFLLSIVVNESRLNWNDLKLQKKTWNDVSTQGWD